MYVSAPNHYTCSRLCKPNMIFSLCPNALVKCQWKTLNNQLIKTVLSTVLDTIWFVMFVGSLLSILGHRTNIQEKNYTISTLYCIDNCDIDYRWSEGKKRKLCERDHEMCILIMETPYCIFDTVVRFWRAHL